MHNNLFVLDNDIGILPESYWSFRTEHLETTIPVISYVLRYLEDVSAVNLRGIQFQWWQALDYYGLNRSHDQVGVHSIFQSLRESIFTTFVHVYAIA